MKSGEVNQANIPWPAQFIARQVRTKKGSTMPEGMLPPALFGLRAVRT
jgi:hypothetical protein